MGEEWSWRSPGPRMLLEGPTHGMAQAGLQDAASCCTGRSKFNEYFNYKTF